MTSKKTHKKSKEKPHENSHKKSPPLSLKSGAEQEEKKSQEKSPPSDDLYPKRPAFLRRWHEALIQSRWRQGVVLALILGALSTVAILLAQRIIQPDSLAEYLPADQTIWFIETDVAAYAELSEQAGEDFPIQIQTFTPMECALFFLAPRDWECAMPEWAGGHAGRAMIQETEEFSTWTFVAVADPVQAKQSMDDGEFEGVWYEVVGDYLVIGDARYAETAERMISIKNREEPSLKQDEHYRNLRPHLAYDAAVFGYFHTEKTWAGVLANAPWENEESELSDTIAETEATEDSQTDETGEPEEESSEFSSPWTIQILGETLTTHELLDDLVPWFPVGGFTITGTDEGGMIFENYWMADKALKDGEALVHFETKYHGALLEVLPANVGRVVGGQNAAEQLRQWAEVLTAAGNDWGQHWMDRADEKRIAWWGNDVTVEETFGALFEEEFALIWMEEMEGDVEEASEPEEATAETDESAELEGETSETDDEPSEPELLSWVLVLELNKETEALVTELQDTMVERGIFEIDQENSSIRQIEVNRLTRSHSETEFVTLRTEYGVDWLHLLIQDRALFATQDIAAMQALIDGLEHTESSYKMGDTWRLMDHVAKRTDWVTDQALWGGSMWQAEHEAFGVNAFDDGIQIIHWMEWATSKGSLDASLDENSNETLNDDTPLENLDDGQLDDSSLGTSDTSADEPTLELDESTPETDETPAS